MDGCAMAGGWSPIFRRSCERVEWKIIAPNRKKTFLTILDKKSIIQDVKFRIAACHFLCHSYNEQVPQDTMWKCCWQISSYQCLLCVSSNYRKYMKSISFVELCIKLQTWRLYGQHKNTALDNIYVCVRACVYVYKWLIFFAISIKWCTNSASVIASHFYRKNNVILVLFTPKNEDKYWRR